MSKNYLINCFLLLGVCGASLTSQASSLPVVTQRMAPIRVSGRVTLADTKDGAPGVNVLEKGTTNGTTTDAAGNFSLTVADPNAVLVFTFIGYASEEIKVGNQTSLNVTLQQDIKTLSEVMVVGYGTVRKADATGSVAVINSNEFNKGAVNSPQELIIGKTAGVVITSNSGAPGNTSTIRIRGGASLSASNDPLIVVDGVPLDNTPVGGSANLLASINPNDIETFTILKDASATAIYGSRASNGVILITTKRGGQGMKITYSATASLATIPHKLDVYSGDEYRALVKKVYNDNTAVLSLLGNANTEWQNEIYRNAFGQDHNLSVSGTAKKLPYRVSVGYNNTNGTLKTYQFERTTASIGLDPSFLKDHLKVHINVKGLLNHNNFADQGAVRNAVVYDPTQPVYNGNSRWRGYTSWTLGGINGDAINLATPNPVAQLDLTDNTSNVQRSIGNIQLDYKLPFLPDLHANLNLGYDYTDSKGHNNIKDSAQWIYNPEVAGGQINPYRNKNQNQLLDFYLSYSKSLDAIHSRIEATAGYSWSHFYRSVTDSVMNESETIVTRPRHFESEYYLVSFFGRLNYTLKDKYLVTFTLRDDGTSRFSPDNRWGLFPAVAIGWKINQEAFLQNSRTISDLKLRLGYGITGQQDLNGGNFDYAYLANYTRSDQASRYQFGDTFYNTLRPDGYDANIKWETTTTQNIGLDYGLFGNRITGTLDFYSRKTEDLLSFVPVPVGTNFTGSLLTNVGSMENKGIEFLVNGKVIAQPDLTWEIGYNISYNQNKLTKLNLNNDPNYLVPTGNIAGTTSGFIQAQKVGYPINSFFVFEQVYKDGKPLEDVYVDRNNDGVINSSDLYIYQKPAPNVLMGISSRWTYKNWDFSLSGRVSLGNYVYNNVASGSNYNVYSSLNYLTNTTTQANATQFTTALNTIYSDYYIENASFFRLDNINVGYSFKQLFNTKVNARIGAGVQNVFFVTKYNGLDPEISGGLDNNFFPRSRTFQLNLRVDL